jgi:hypothetical protein
VPDLAAAMNLQDWRLQHLEFCSQLEELIQFTHDDLALFNPYPVAISSDAAISLQNLGNILLRALYFIATRYLQTPELRELMPLRPRALELLEICQNIPYSMGMARPDILFGIRGEMKICEINARFPANGMMLSQELACAASKVSYLDPAEFKVPEAVLSLSARQLQRFERDRPLALLNQVEKGNESLFLLNRFRQSGGQTLRCTPSSLTRRGDRLMFKGQQLDQFILELTVDELLEIDPRVLAVMAGNCDYFNDIRTIILVHDKRVLAALGHQPLMRECLGTDDAAILQSFLLPTSGLHNAAAFNAAQANKSQWVLKGNSSGRGLGLLIGEQTGAQAWLDALGQDRSEWMVQRYLESMPFQAMGNWAGEIGQQQTTIVGSLPCFDDVVFGPGLFRISRERVIAGPGDMILAGVIGNQLGKTLVHLQPL